MNKKADQPPAKIITASSDEKLLRCKKCRRLANQLTKLRQSHPDYWNQPVPAYGPADANLLIVGLAPGMHGANRSGRPFVGDASGDLLNEVLATTGLTDRVRVTNAVKCLPIKNLPSGQEVNHCSRFLQDELDQHGKLARPVLLALGGVAHRAIIRALGQAQKDFTFSHGAQHDLGGISLIDSYHCSRYNTQTGRLTPAMFLDVIRRAGNMAYP